MIDAQDQRLITRDEVLIHEHAIRKALKAAVGLILSFGIDRRPAAPSKENRGNAFRTETLI